MFGLYPGNHFKRSGHFGKTFFLCRLCKSGIQYCPFFIFPLGSSFQVFCSRTDLAGRISCRYFGHASLQEFKESLGMFFFLVCGLLKNGSNLLIAFLLRYFDEKLITVSGLGLACK